MKKLLSLMVITSAFFLVVGTAQAAAPKTTGGIVFGLNGTRTNFGYEASSDGSTARGTATWVRTGDVWANTLAGKVVSANITGRDADFTVQITKSSNFPSWIGLQLKFFVHDGGTPGPEGDTVAWQWVTGPYVGSAYGEPIVSGNLKVMP
jgi:hypothetical protein